MKKTYVLTIEDGGLKDTYRAEVDFNFDININKIVCTDQDGRQVESDSTLSGAIDLIKLRYDI